jgi:glycine cleavage system aminomethyltransferase T
MRTPLYEEHLALNASIVDFAGWDMPVMYTTIIEEHNATRSAAGLFDICHMGEFRLRGADAKVCSAAYCRPPWTDFLRAGQCTAVCAGRMAP